MKKKERLSHFNNKGFAITSIIYAMLFLFIILMTLTLLTLARRKNLLDKEKNDAKTLLNEFYEVYQYGYTGDVQTFTVPRDGYYKIELWGAQGGSNEFSSGGKGAYTEGYVYLNKNQNLYIYVGGMGNNANNTTAMGGYNGGGKSVTSNENDIAGSGGGATDIRLINGNDSTSLNSRIMVAAGGGGAYYFKSFIGAGGAGGALNGIQAESLQCTNRILTLGSVATQNVGAYNNFCSTVDYSNNPVLESGFGFGADGTRFHSGGGAGYYGGGNGYATGGSGGSSFISGYDGCDAVDQNGNHTGQSVHYSGIKFSNSNMISGDLSMPTYDGTNIMVGNSGDGYAKITYVGVNSSNLSVDLKYDSEISSLYLPTINDNNFSISASGLKFKLELPNAGYAFDWIFNTGNGILSFCNSNDQCTILKNTREEEKGNYITTEAGYLSMSFSGVNMYINNITYKGEKVKINAPIITAPSITVKSDCVYSTGSFTCQTINNNGDSITGDAYAFAPNKGNYKQLFSVDGADWQEGSGSGIGYFVKISGQGRHTVKARTYYSSQNVYSAESDEFVIYIN